MVPTWRERTRTHLHRSESEPQRGNVLERVLALEPKTPGFKPQLCHLLSVWYFTSGSLAFSVCKTNLFTTSLGSLNSKLCVFPKKGNSVGALNMILTPGAEMAPPKPTKACVHEAPGLP